MRITSPQCLSRGSLVLSLSLFCSIAQAQQQVTSTSLPDAPDPHAPYSSSAQTIAADQQQSAQDSTSAAPQHQDGQTRRILGIIPNFRAVNAGTKLPPQTGKDKFSTASQDSFDYSSVVLPAAISAISLARNSVPEFHEGTAGYGRYFWHSFTDQTIENYIVEFIIPSIHHEDTRYYTLGEGDFLKRSTYAIGRVVVTKSDTGQSTFNAGEVIGAGAAAGISNLYYPRSQRDFSQTGERWGLNIGIDAATFVFKEFWPDINHSLFHARNQ
jgi:hypothetical protein